MRRTCSQPDCDRPAFGRGLCSAHYQRARYHGELPTERGPRTCAHCGSEFRGRKWNATYCSKTCDDNARYARNAGNRRQPSCDQCGASLDQRRRDARFCSVECAQGWRNAQIANATLTANRNRPPCKGCGGPVAPERFITAEYCTEQCKIRSRRHEAYGLTLVELTQLLEQHEVCAICKTSDWDKKGPQVDHDHETGEVRGILCGNCNQGLGRFGDDPARLRAAADYLERYALA